MCVPLKKGKIAKKIKKEFKRITKARKKRVRSLYLFSVAALLPTVVLTKIMKKKKC